MDFIISLHLNKLTNVLICFSLGDLIMKETLIFLLITFFSISIHAEQNYTIDENATFRESTDELVNAREITINTETHPGIALYRDNCAICHDGTVKKAPALNWIELLTPPALLRAMNQGIMSEQASHLSEEERILNAGRALTTLPRMIVKKDKAGIEDTLEQISTIEEEVENLRRKITRDVADVGGLIMNRENLLNTAYTMDEIAGYITGIYFKLSNVKVSTLKNENLEQELTELIELVVDEIYKLNQIIRTLGTDTAKSIELAQETQKIEREIDTKYRVLSIKAMNKISDTKELLLVKDIIEGIEEMADKCQEVSDSFILLALSL